MSSLKRRGLLFFLLTLFPFTLITAQFSISGTISDASSGEPLIGANIMLKGQTTGTVTNISGGYILPNLTSGSYTLRVTFIGYKSVEQQVVINRESITQNISLQPDIQTLEQTVSEGTEGTTHDYVVTTVAAGKEGVYAYSGSEDGTVKKWIVETGELVRTFRFETGILAIDISPDGRHLIAADEDGELMLVDAQNGSLIRYYEEHDCDVIWDVEFSPDGSSVISAGDDYYVRMWNVRTGDLVKSFEGHDDEVFAARFSSDARYLVSASADETAKVWNVERGSLIRTFEGHDDWVNSVDISSDNQTLLTGSDDGKIILWDTSNGQKLKSIDRVEEYIYYVEFSPDDVFFLSIGDNYDYVVNLFTVDTGEKLASYEGHSDELYTATFTADGDHFLSGSYDNTMRHWSLASLSALKIFSY